ncbi:MAG: DUF5615 family PIN-like protein [Planctomycetes bacterium]|nr:DUF5615 family PIN-like protein [Planctomycetota bacterium]
MMRFLVDMPLPPFIVEWLNRSCHDAVHASTAGLFISSDDAILSRARAESRIVITADLDYPRLLALSRADGPGLILFRGGEWTNNELIDRLSRTFESIEERSLGASIVSIDKQRIRRRSLPIT